MRLLFAGINNVADPIRIDSLNPKSSQYGQCVDICNCDLDDEHNAIRRDGFELASMGIVCTAAWTDKNGIAWLIADNRIARFDGIGVTTLANYGVTVQPNCEFEQVNDVVVFSDGEKIGVITDINTFTLVDNVNEWIAAEDLEAWVASHYPADPAKWDGITSNSNFGIDAFKLSTLAGTCLHHFNGTLYLAIDNFVYATKTHDIEHMDIRYNIIAGFPDPVTMIQHVADGLYVSTSQAVYFLSGTGRVVDESGKIHADFSQTQVFSYGAIYGTGMQVSLLQIPSLQATGMAVVWSCTEGIIAGLPGGAIVNLSAGKIKLADVTSGIALVKNMPKFSQYITRLSDGSTWVLNLKTLAHSRFTNYGFNGFFQRAGSYYGVNAVGIFKLGGNMDYAGPIGLATEIDAFIVTPQSDFNKKESKLLQSLYIQAKCDGDMAVDYLIDSQPVYDDDLILFDGTSQPHTLRAHPPRGMRGAHLQFKLKNIKGCSFTASYLEPVVVVSNRTR